jgi:hypothetical protein
MRAEFDDWVEWAEYQRVAASMPTFDDLVSWDEGAPVHPAMMDFVTYTPPITRKPTLWQRVKDFFGRW